jgi:DNA helicase-2/ATP-dependent DNA helicase PcrA
MLLNVTGTPDWRLYSYDGRRTVFRLLNIAKDIRRTHEGAVAWLRQAAGEFSTVLVEEGFMPSDKAHILADSAEAMVADMTKNSVDIANLSTGELGIYAQPGACLQLMTLHKSKGQEFEAVAIVDLHDNKIPHWTASTDEEIAEARRLLYVGATRAKTLLMYFTDSSNYRNRPSRFLGTNGLGLLH